MLRSSSVKSLALVVKDARVKALEIAVRRLLFVGVFVCEKRVEDLNLAMLNGRHQAGSLIFNVFFVAQMAVHKTPIDDVDVSMSSGFLPHLLFDIESKKRKQLKRFKLTVPGCQDARAAVDGA